jgi:hypothetical protein
VTLQRRKSCSIWSTPLRFHSYYVCEGHFWEGQTYKEFWNIYHVQVHNGNKTPSLYTITFYETFLSLCMVLFQTCLCLFSAIFREIIHVYHREILFFFFYICDLLTWDVLQMFMNKSFTKSVYGKTCWQNLIHRGSSCMPWTEQQDTRTAW